MKKNVRDYKKVGVQFAYVLDCIYNDEKDNMSDKEAINYFFDCFNKIRKSQTKDNLRRFFGSYTSINIDVYNAETNFYKGTINI